MPIHRTVLLVALPLCFALFAACMPARGNDPASPTDSTEMSDPDVIEGTGTVVRMELEGGFFAIRGDDGNTYDPTNLAEEFRQDGLRVRYELRPRPDMMSTHMVGMIVDVIHIERI